MLAASDLLSPAEAHYLYHVVKQQEWPVGTSLADYVDSIQRVILDPSGRMFTNRYVGQWSLGIIRESRDLRGPGGYDWVLVQYRVGYGYWATAFQPADGLDELRKPDWSDIRWLRRPKRSSVS